MSILPPAVLLEGVHFSYPPLAADRAPVEILRGVTWRAPAGQALGVVSATGGGKTTLALTLAGLAPQLTGGERRGLIWINGLDATQTPAAVLSQSLGLVFQESERQLFSMSVANEIAFGLEGQGLPPEDISARVAWTLQRVGLAGMEDRSPWRLSGGQQKRLALACILAMRPPVVALDEPMDGLDPQGRRDLLAVLDELKHDAGVTALVLEKDTEWLAGWADDVAVLHEGKIVQQGSAAQAQEAITQHPEWGLSATPAAIELPPTPLVSAEADAPPAVEVRDLWFRYPDGIAALQGVSLVAPRGQFLVLVGPNGGGKSTLARHLNGLLRGQRGEVLLHGRPTADRAVADLAADVGYVFQNPDHQLFAPSVREEIAFGLRNQGLRGVALQARVEEALAAFNLSQVADDPPAVLSYGLRRAVTLAAVWAMQPAIWVLDEPSTGLDARLTGGLLAQLRTLHAAGHTLVLITHDARLALAAERAVLLHEGRIVADGPPVEVLAASEAMTPAAEPSLPWPAVETGWLHRLDPRTKLALAGGGAALFALFNQVGVLAGLLAALHVLLFSAHVSRRQVGAVWRQLLRVLVVIVVLFPLFSRAPGRLWLAVGPFHITDAGVLQGLATALRVIGMSLLFYLVLFTTRQSALVRGLVRLGLPFEWGLTLAIALRYIPTFTLVVQQIQQAQAARGWPGRSGGRTLLRRAQGVIPVMVALMIDVLRTGDTLGMALAARGVGAGRPRSVWREIHMRRVDWVVLAAIGAVCGALLAARAVWGVGAAWW